MRKVWRYLTKEKLEWLLADKGLYFGPANLQTDKEEGVYDSTIPGALFERNPEKYIPVSALDYRPDFYRPQLDLFSEQMMEGARKSNFLNSWYLGDAESTKMWEDYARDGVVIVSTVDKLVNQAPYPQNHALTFCEVGYNDELKKKEILEPLKVKNASYSHECEFRIIFDARKYSLLTGYGRESFGQVLIGGKPSYECLEFTAGMGGVIDTTTSSEFIVKKNTGYVILYSLASILTEVRLSPLLSKQHQLKLHTILSNSGLSVPVVCSEFSNNG